LHVELGTLETVDACLALPLAIAEAHAAHVAALVFATGAFRDASGADMTSTTDQDLIAREDAVAVYAQKVLEARGLRFEVRGRGSFAYGVGEVFADQMRVSDLGIMSFGPGADVGKRFVASAEIFSSRRLLLLLPPDHIASSPPSRIVLAWDASPAAVRAVHGALPFIKRAEAVTVVSLANAKEFRQGQSGVELAHLLARHGANAAFRPVQRGRGGIVHAILDVAREVQADMMVMGAVRHAPLHNLVFGRATMDLLDQGPTLPDRRRSRHTGRGAACAGGGLGRRLRPHQPRAQVAPGDRTAGERPDSRDDRRLVERRAGAQARQCGHRHRP
jgi:nucleotide-binding universal stress UspA family protein